MLRRSDVVLQVHCLAPPPTCSSASDAKRTTVKKKSGHKRVELQGTTRLIDWRAIGAESSTRARQPAFRPSSGGAPSSWPCLSIIGTSENRMTESLQTFLGISSFCAQSTCQHFNPYTDPQFHRKACPSPKGEAETKIHTSSC